MDGVIYDPFKKEFFNSLLNPASCGNLMILRVRTMTRGACGALSLVPYHILFRNLGGFPRNLLKIK
jgi:hypothetical protein